MQSAAISKIVLSPYLRRQSSDFDQIWYTYVNFHSETGQLMNNRSFALKTAMGLHTVFKIGNCLYLGLVWLIYEKFVSGMQNHMQT